jgi:hypothetical protein
VTIQDFIVRWCNGIAFSFHWVKGHAYLIDRPLTRNERLKIETDLQADVVGAQARGPIAARPNCVHWDIEEALHLSLSLTVATVLGHHFLIPWSPSIFLIIDPPTVFLVENRIKNLCF